MWRGQCYYQKKAVWLIGDRANSPSFRTIWLQEVVTHAGRLQMMGHVGIKLSAISAAVGKNNLCWLRTMLRGSKHVMNGQGWQLLGARSQYGPPPKGRQFLNRSSGSKYVNFLVSYGGSLRGSHLTPLTLSTLVSHEWFLWKFVNESHWLKMKRRDLSGGEKGMRNKRKMNKTKQQMLMTI